MVILVAAVFFFAPIFIITEIPRIKREWEEWKE